MIRNGNTVYHIQDKEFLGIVCNMTKQDITIRWEDQHTETLMIENLELLKLAKKRQLKTCNGCNKVTKFDKRLRDITLDAFENASGFHCLVDIEGQLIWMCPDCFKKLQVSVSLIKEIIGPRNITIHQLQKIKKYGNREENNG